MSDILQNINSGFSQMMGWELVAVFLALAYLLLIMRENILGWPCALVSTAIYIVLFWEVSLLMDSALNVYYLIMALYGWWHWTSGGSNKQELAIQRWQLRSHAFALAVILGATLISGYLLSQNTAAAWPYLDSFTTWGSVITTYMVARKVLENWLYWILIDSVALGLYIERGLYFTAMLFMGYLIICVFGYFSWKKKLGKPQPITAST